MKISPFILSIVFILFNHESIQAQYLDTMVYDYTQIVDITALDDGTFILIGYNRGAVKVSRINSKTEPIWSHTLTDSIFYEIRNYEVRTFENDSSIQIITHKGECDIVPPGTAHLFTIDLNGFIKDTVFINFEDWHEKIFILSGIDSLPRCAFIQNDSVILRYSIGIDKVVKEPYDLFGPRVVDMSPFGDLVVHYNFGSLRFYRLVENEYMPIAGGSSSPDTWHILYIDSNLIALNHGEYVSVIDTYGFEFNKFFRKNSWFSEVKLKDSFLYFDSYGFESDSFYVTDLHLNPIHILPHNQSKNVDDIAINNNILFITGKDYSSPHSYSSLESENFLTHEGHQFYDLELIGYQAVPADSFVFGDACYVEHFTYYFPEITVTIRNNGEFKVSESTIGYEAFGNCCTILSWQHRITGMNLMPGESKDYSIQGFYAPRYYPLYGTFDHCIFISAPDHHTDDLFDNNMACAKGLLTAEDYPSVAKNMVASIFPNPLTDQSLLSISGIDEGGIIIAFSNVLGQLCKEIRTSDREILLERSDFSEGITFYQITKGTHTLASGKILVK